MQSDLLKTTLHSGLQYYLPTSFAANNFSVLCIMGHGY